MLLTIRHNYKVLFRRIVVCQMSLENALFLDLSVQEIWVS